MHRAKELRRQQRYQEKSRFESGLWNVNTVVMGGLGGDPEICSSDEGEPHIIDQELDFCQVTIHTHC